MSGKNIIDTATIIVKKPGHLIDPDYLRLAFDKNPTAIGTAVVDRGKLYIDRGTERPSFEEFCKGLEQAKDQHLILWLANMTSGKIDEADIQPFALYEGDEPKLAVFLEGDFAKFSDPVSGHTDWFNCAEQIVFPTLTEVYELGNGDEKKIREKLEGSLFEKNMLAHVSHRGVFALLPTEGGPIAFGQNELGESYEWGSVSNTHGYDPNAQKEQEPVSEPAKTSRFSFLRGGKSATADAKVEPTPPPAPTPEPEKPVIENNPAPTPPATETATLDGKKGKMVAVPDNLGGKERKRHIRKLMGLNAGDKLPPGYQSRGFKVFVPDTVASTLEDLKKKKEEEQKQKHAAAVSTLKNKEPSTTRVQNVGDNKVRTVSEFPDKAPTITESQKKTAMDFVVKRLDANSNPTIKPNEIQKMERKYPTFSEATGVQLEDTFKLFYHDMVDFCKAHPEQAALAWKESRDKYMDTLKVEDLAGTKKPEPAKVETPAEPEKKVASGGSKFGFLRR